MRRRSFIAALGALFVAPRLNAYPIQPSLRCHNCGKVGGKPVFFWEWNDQRTQPVEACTLCQDTLDLEGYPAGIRIDTAEEARKIVANILKDLR